MNDALSLLTFDWFIKHAAIGILIGYFLRVGEHVIWSIKTPREENPRGNFLFALMILPQCLLFGAALGYILLAVIVVYFKNQSVIEASAFLVPGFMAFIAVDFRDLLRRISRM
jgi:hypothetical protein